MCWLLHWPPDRARRRSPFVACLTVNKGDMVLDENAVVGRLVGCGVLYEALWGADEVSYL